MTTTLDLDFTLATTTTSPTTWDSGTATAVTLSGGNLVVTSTTTSGDQGARGPFAAGKTTGKHYFEIRLTTEAGGGNTGFGVGTTDATYTAMGNNGTLGAQVFLNGAIYANAVNTGSQVGDPASGHTVAIAVNLDTRKIWFRNLSIADQASAQGGWNGVPDLGGVQNPATGSGGLTVPAGTIVPFCTFNASGNVFTANFGGSAFIGAVPSGFASGWIATTTTTTLDPRITFTRTTTATYFDSAGGLRTAAINAPRFDYDPVTHVAKGLLIEEARTNSGGNSDDFAHANWVKTGATVTANQIVCPDGTTSADLLTASATAASLSFPVGINTGLTYVQSIYAKKGTSDWIYMIGQSVDVPKVWFNLNTGAVGTIQAGIMSAAIENVGNGWFRCSFVDVGQAGTENHQIGISDADNSATVTIGRTGYLWGAQSEIGASISSYIPTGGGSNIARAADVAVMTGANFSDWYNQAAGTFAVEFDVFSALSNRYIMVADDNTVTERIALQSSFGGDGLGRVTVLDNSTGQFTGGVFGAVALNTVYKLAVSFAVNDFAACLNGGTVATDTSGTLPTLTQLRIGSEGVLFLNGHVRRIQFQNVAVDDATLQAAPQPPTGTSEPVPPAIGPTTTGGAAFWDQEYDGREYESSRKRRKRFLEERARRVREL